MILENDKSLVIVTNLKFILERLRVVSRLFMVGYMIALYQAIQWVYGLPDISGAQSAILSSLAAIASILTKFYVDTGRNLYDDYEDIKYANKFVMHIDKFGYIIDKFRLFPLIFVLFYLFFWYDAFMWAMSVEVLSNAQATFVSIYSGIASVVLGLFITSGDVSLNLEKNFLKRFTANEDIVESDDEKKSSKQ